MVEIARERFLCAQRGAWHVPHQKTERIRGETHDEHHHPDLPTPTWGCHLGVSRQGVSQQGVSVGALVETERLARQVGEANRKAKP